MEATAKLAADGPQIRRLLYRYLLIRLAVTAFFLGGTLAYELKTSGAPGLSPLAGWLAALSCVALSQAVLSLALLKRTAKLPTFVHAQLSWDLLFVTAVIYLTGGHGSLYSFLYILVIIAASVFLSRREVLVVASGASILYGSLLDLQFFRYLPLFGAGQPPGPSGDEVFYAVIVNVGAFLLTALLSGNLAERLRHSETARAEQEVDYDRLRRLNQSIQENITSGLLVIGHDRRIQLFNQSAARITGYAFHEVYNQPVERFFPTLTHLDGRAAVTVRRGEMRLKNRGGELLTIGYTASQIRDPQGEELGLLVSFQDLTAVKAMEVQLKRADRLAAVGSLASGLAHEIRNPLASISGSVQLLSEDPRIGDENRRLMWIVHQEVRRLNTLLGSFLDFARPAPLQRERVNLALVIDELAALLHAGGQAGEVAIERRYAPSLPMYVDSQKLRQSLWDLLLNAVESAAPRGAVRVTVDPLNGEITIEDSGAGIDDALRERIFEPFFTTKAHGTGLGLANVYANVQAHGGQIHVSASSLGGARFTIDLPDDCFLPADQEPAHDLSPR